MTQKEEFLQLKSYEEFERKRDRFKGLKLDREILEHMNRIFPKIEKPQMDANIALDPRFPIRKKTEAITE